VIRNGDDIIEHTIDFWLQRTPVEVSPEDAREAAANAVAFFQVLSDWDQHATEINDSDATCSAVGPDRGQTKTAN